MLSSNTENSSYILKEIHIPFEDVVIWCETSTSKNRPFLPNILRETVFKSIHGLSHPSGRVTRKLRNEQRH